ncbi:MAG: hypothetical protein LBP42_06540 [Treponema sp.]|nr:hypothetical protein [Treponema sp.]
MDAQIFKPFTRLRVIQTVHFEIIFPAESELTARTLAVYADEVYERVSSLLGLSLNQKVPVMITPHTEEFNGYMNPIPYPHIVLYDTPMTPEWTGFENSLKSLFTHEMTHAVSLSTRGPFWEGLHRIFGGWVYPAALTAPLFMVEGVTVSFESLDGFGRANDPLIKEALRQAIYEDNILTPFQTAGVYDLPPAKSAHYYYGGLFSAYLQKTYGMEKYAELWQAMGRRYHFCLFFYNNGYCNLFKKVYGLPFLEVWENFRADLALDPIEDNRKGIIRGGKALITGIAAGGDKVFVLDRLAHKVAAYDPASGKSDTPVAVDSFGYALAASDDGKDLLVSSYRYAEARAQAVVTAYRAGGGKTGRVWRGLYGGSYFRDGVIGLSSSGHINNLVFRKDAGKPGPETEELLLRGSAELIYSHPQAVNDTWIAFIALKQGKRQLNLYNYETKKVYRLSSALEDDAQRWQYIRSLNKSKGYLLFGYNHDDRMYKLGVVDVRDLPGETSVKSPEAVFTEHDFSGGVFLPVTVKEEIYYRGAFATWDALMKYPETVSGLSGVRTSLSLIPWGEEELAVAEPERPPQLPPLSPAKSRMYLPFKYFNPLRLWFPIPYIRSTGNFFSLDGGGIFSFLSDPADIHWIILSANMDARFYMSALDIQWINLNLGIPLNLRFMDYVEMLPQDNYRITHGTITGTLNRGIGNERRRFIFTAGAGFTLLAEDPQDGSGAYTWDYQAPFFNGLAGVQISNLRRFSWEHFGQGVSAAYTSRFVLSKTLFRHEAVFKAAFEPYLPLGLTLYGILDKNGMTLHGTSQDFTVTSISNTAAVEYSTIGIRNLTWLGGGEAELKLFSLNLQDNISHLYFNRLFSTLAYRGALYDSRNIADPPGSSIGTTYRLTQSLILRFGSDISIAALTALPVRISPYMWTAWKISTLGDNISANNFMFGFNFSLNLP